MWKRMKDSFIAGFRKGFRRKKKGFTGFKVELYRDGVLLTSQVGHVHENMAFNITGGVVINGITVHGYTLIPIL